MMWAVLGKALGDRMGKTYIQIDMQLAFEKFLD